MKVMIPNARIAFPYLWKPQPGDNGKSTYGALLIIPPDNPALNAIKQAMAAVAKEKWGAKAEAIYKTLKAQDRLALHDGETKAQYAGFEGNLFISARSQTKPSVYDRNRSPLSADDGKPYAGCYVNASVEFWAQDSQQYGKRINAQLRGVQFVSDGDAFGGGGSASEDEFDDLSDHGSGTSTGDGNAFD